MSGSPSAGQPPAVSRVRSRYLTTHGPLRGFCSAHWRRNYRSPTSVMAARVERPFRTFPFQRNRTRCDRALIPDALGTFGDVRRGHHDGRLRIKTEPLATCTSGGRSGSPAPSARSRFRRRCPRRRWSLQLRRRDASNPLLTPSSRGESYQKHHTGIQHGVGVGCGGRSGRVPPNQDVSW